MQDGLGAVESVLVLGGTSEIACATLRRLVQQRTRRVTLAGRDLGRLGEVADDLRELGATTVDCIRFDAGELASHDALVEEAFSSGDVDVVLAAFGILGDQDDAEQRAPAAVRGLGGLLDELDELVVEAGGRVYLAKDSRLAPHLVPRMYPDLDRLRELRARLDPSGVMQSDLARRLQLL